MSENQSKSTSLINLEDLAGLGAVGTRIVDAAKEAFGALWRPVRLKEEADGEAYRITAVARAEAERHRVLSEVDEELVARANQRVLSQEIQRQENLEAIVKESLRQSIENDHKHADQPELDDAIDPDWMVRFRNLAQDISHSGMQKVWGQVLESEARRPGSYSFRGLDCLSHMRHADAELFQKACNLAFDNCRIFLTKDTDPPGGVQGFLTYNEILLLRAMALIHDDPSTIFVCSPAPKSGQLGNNGTIVRFENDTFEKKELVIRQILFTPVGQELSRLVEMKPNIPYLRQFKEYMNSVGYDVQVILPVGEDLARVIV